MDTELEQKYFEWLELKHRPFGQLKKDVARKISIQEDMFCTRTISQVGESIDFRQLAMAGIVCHELAEAGLIEQFEHDGARFFRRK